jgi:hypothetical protein
MKKGVVLFQRHDCSPEHLEKFILGEWKECPDKEITEPMSIPIPDLVNEFLGKPMGILGEHESLLAQELARENQNLRFEIEALGEFAKVKFRNSGEIKSREIPKSDIPAQLTLDGHRYCLLQEKACFDTFDVFNRGTLDLFTSSGGYKQSQYYSDGALVREHNAYLMQYIKVFPTKDYLTPRDHAILCSGCMEIYAFMANGKITVFRDSLRSIFYNEPQFPGFGRKLSVPENKIIPGGRSVDVVVQHDALSRSYELVLEITGHEYELVR